MRGRACRAGHLTHDLTDEQSAEADDPGHEEDGPDSVMPHANRLTIGVMTLVVEEERATSAPVE